MKHLFNRNMGNFKFNFLSRGRLESKSIDNAFLNVFKMITGMSTSLVTLFLHLLLERSAEIVLTSFLPKVPTIVHTPRRRLARRG